MIEKLIKKYYEICLGNAIRFKNLEGPFVEEVFLKNRIILNKP